jgi:hypothetical protein
LLSTDSINLDLPLSVFQDAPSASIELIASPIVAGTHLPRFARRVPVGERAPFRASPNGGRLVIALAVGKALLATGFTARKLARESRRGLSEKGCHADCAKEVFKLHLVPSFVTKAAIAPQIITDWTSRPLSWVNSPAVSTSQSIRSLRMTARTSTKPFVSRNSISIKYSTSLQIWM